jgi:hypothetical protein
MKLYEYFKTVIESNFLYTKVPKKDLLSNLLCEHIGKFVNIIEYNNNYVLINLKFEDVQLSFKMNIVEGQNWLKFYEIEYIENEREV